MRVESRSTSAALVGLSTASIGPEDVEVDAPLVAAELSGAEGGGENPVVDIAPRWSHTRSLEATADNL